MSRNKLCQIKAEKLSKFEKKRICMQMLQYGFNLFDSLDYIHRIDIPRVLNRNSLGDFLYNIEFIFGEMDLKYPLFLSFSKCTEASNSGLLAVYIALKIVFEKYPKILKLFNYSVEVGKILNKKGFFPLYERYIKGVDPCGAQNALFEIHDNNFFMFPQRLTDMTEYEKQKLNDNFIVKISEFYVKNGSPKSVSPIGTCIGEVISNFWSHANSRNDTYILAEGNSNRFKLYILDTGRGIISTLRDRYKTKSDSDLFLDCIKKGVSSKKDCDKSSYHMGCGLYYISEIVKNNGGFLDIWSEGFRLSVASSKVQVSNSGYWAGTIMELSFCVLHAKGIHQILKGDTAHE